MANLTLHPDLAAAIQLILTDARQPLTVAKIKSSLPASHKVKPKLKDAFAALLDAEAAAGRIHVWPSKKTVKYSTLNPREWASQAILKAAAEPVVLTKLVSAVSKQYPKKDAETLVAAMAETGELIRVPLFGIGPKTKYASVIADAASFRAELDAARVILDAGYRRLGDADWRSFREASPPTAAKPDIMSTLAELEPQKGLLVTSARLRRVLTGWNKHELDAALVRLQLERKVILHRHSNAAALGGTERETLIHDPETGTYFVGVCWRVTPENP